MINKLVKDTLAHLNTPVAFQKYSGTATTYITFFEYAEKGEFWADNQELQTGHYIQVDVWSKSDYTTLAGNILSALIDAGFRRQYSNDLYENDTGFYHRVMRFNFVENKEGT